MSDTFVTARRDFERDYFEKLVALTGGSKSKMAAVSGLHRTAVYKLMRRLGLQSIRVHSDGKAPVADINMLAP